ncbi:hypothetical protein IWQ62_005092 [Dispira parvispora]|uniref:glutathione gamma-glutamylcysteinyltransferase n=1 Tax=Dispira parvispora TaxID=1520584 RepID=A0A9W8E1D4_9FUNG|nr:hypothetical protein IWQ62_005092 [Dispira parvispora]
MPCCLPSPGSTSLNCFLSRAKPVQSSFQRCCGFASLHRGSTSSTQRSPCCIAGRSPACCLAANASSATTNCGSQSLGSVRTSYTNAAVTNQVTMPFPPLPFIQGPPSSPRRSETPLGLPPRKSQLFPVEVTVDQSLSRVQEPLISAKENASKTSPVSSVSTATLASPKPVPQSFYRRQLPKSLVAFTSAQGRNFFKESLLQGYAEGYFNLAGNFTTQSEPAYCGPSSLAMVLNALEVDPGRLWKGVWRWYSDELIRTCASPEVVKKTGITFDQFECMAASHGNVVAKRGDQVTQQEFLEDIKRVSSCTDEFMVVSFSRKTLQQTGDGHFSPIGAYHPASNSVLVLDTARFKYPSYFVTVDTLYQALQPLDGTTGKPRGYFLIRASADVPRATPTNACTDKASSSNSCRRICGQKATS